MPEIFITWGPGSNYWGTNVHQKIASHFLVSLNPFSAGLVIFDLKVKKKDKLPQCIGAFTDFFKVS